jgi:hypothetical protein
LRKLLTLCLVLGAAVALWKFGLGSGGGDAITDLEQRLAAAESAYQSAGRAAGMAGIDTTADAAAALAEVDRVVAEARDLGRNAASDEEKRRLARVRDRAEALRARLR